VQNVAAGESALAELRQVEFGFFGELNLQIRRAHSNRWTHPPGVCEGMRVRSCRPIFFTIVRSVTVWGPVLVELRRCEHRSLQSARASPNFEVRSAWGKRAIYPDALYSMS